MKFDWLTKALLLLIAAAVVSIALHPYVAPPPVSAQSEVYPVYIEPGTVMLRAPDGSRQVFGRMVVDLRTGKIWGFPTTTQDPYPITNTTTTPPTSHPFYLGKFAFGDMDK